MILILMKMSYKICDKKICEIADNLEPEAILLENLFMKWVNI